jgi:hypothetical protein
MRPCVLVSAVGSDRPGTPTAAHFMAYARAWTMSTGRPEVVRIVGVPRFVPITPVGSAPNSRYGYKTRGWVDGGMHGLRLRQLVPPM